MNAITVGKKKKKIVINYKINASPEMGEINSCARTYTYRTHRHACRQTDSAARTKAGHI